MRRGIRSLIFTSTITLLILSVFPVAAQVQPLVESNCGFDNINCAERDTFRSKVIPWFDTAITNAFTLIRMAAIIYIIYAGVQYISSGGDLEKASRAKRQIFYATIGLIVASFAGIIADAVIAQDPFSVAVIVNTYTLAALVLIRMAAVIYIIYAGYKYINSQGDTESAAAAKRQLLYAILGIIVVVLASVIADAAETSDVTALAFNITNAVNSALALVAIAAAAYIILSGVMYITSLGDREKAERAKMQLIYATIGILIIVLSAVIVNFVRFAVA